ncbi:hypothetical protein EP47_10995, partial [Legionella norrlandica]
MLRLRLGSHLIEQYRNKGIAYLPDFIIYDIDEKEYQLFWNELTKHPRNQLYTDGIQIYKVSWLQSLFQRFKGWLGFENHCQPNKVELTLAKIAYHGYLRGYDPKELNSINPPLVSERFMKLVSSSRNNNNSFSLQQLLITYFLTYSSYFPGPGRTMSLAFPFGDTFIREGLYKLIPTLDPQNISVITNTITGLHSQFESADYIDCFKSSLFAEYYAEYLVSQRRYQGALDWSDSVKNKFKEQFIQFYLSKKLLDPAIDLIDELSQSPNLEDQDNAIRYIKENFNCSEQLFYLQSKPYLRAQLAKAYLQDAKKEKSRFAITKLILGNNLIPILAHAIKLDPNILDQDSSMHDILMKEEWINFQFNEAIKDKRFQDARILYEQHSHFKFDKENLTILKNNYEEMLFAKLQQIRTDLETKNTESAKKLAIETLEIAKRVAQISPQDNPQLSVSINYAETLLSIDKILHPEIKNADLEQLELAQNFLNQYDLFNKSAYYKQVKNEILLRKIHCLIEKIR